MPNARQLAANRANSKKSTGPVTAEGKQVVSQNAVRHGLLSKGPLMPGEDPAEYQEHRDKLIADLDPQGEMELLLADRIAGCFWKLRREGQLEVALLEHIQEEHLDNDMRFGSPHKNKIGSIYDVPEESPVSEESDGDANESDQSLVTSPENEDDEEDWDEETCRKYRFASMIQAHARDMQSADKMSRLQRYEVQIENMLYRTLNQLQRLQFLRSQGSSVPSVVGGVLGQRKKAPDQSNPSKP